MDAVPSSRLKLDRLKYEKEHNYNNSLLSNDNASLLHGLSAVGDSVASSGNHDYNGPVAIPSRNLGRGGQVKSDEEDNDEEDDFDLESNPSEEGISGHGADSSLSSDSYSAPKAVKTTGSSNSGSSMLLSTSLTRGSMNGSSSRSSYSSAAAANSNSLVGPAGSAQLSIADRRAHHNSLERKRREHIKSSFNGLRDSIPSMVGEKVSRSQILRKAGEYIQAIKRKTSSLNDEVDELRRQNALLDQQIKQLERAQLNPSADGSGQSVATQQRFQSVTLQPLQQQQQQQVHATGGLLLSHGQVFRVTPPAVSGILEGTSDQQLSTNAGEGVCTKKQKTAVVSFIGSQQQSR